MERLLRSARLGLGHGDPSVTAATCTDDGEPDECDDDGGSGGSPPAVNSATHVLTNPWGTIDGVSIATSHTPDNVLGVRHEHYVSVYLNETRVHFDSVKGQANLTHFDMNTFASTYQTTLRFDVCGRSSGYATHVFQYGAAPYFPDDTKYSQDFDSACRLEEQASDGGGGGDGGTDEQGDLWCFFISIYDGSGRLVSRTNTGNCWRQ